MMKGAKNIWEEETISSINDAGTAGESHAKEWNWTVSYTVYLTKINWKWIKDLNVIPETIKFLEDNTGIKLLTLGIVKNFLDLTPKTKEQKQKFTNGINQTVKFLHNKGNLQQYKKVTILNVRKYLQIIYPIRG